MPTRAVMGRPANDAGLSLAFFGEIGSDANTVSAHSTQAPSLRYHYTLLVQGAIPPTIQCVAWLLR